MYGAQLDLRQVECDKLGVTVSDDDKTLHFVQQMYESELFPREFMDDWEDALPSTWDATVTHFAEVYDKIGRVKQRMADREAAGFSSAASLTIARPPPTIATSKA